MTAYDVISLIMDALALIATFGCFVLALLQFLQKRNRDKK